MAIFNPLLDPLKNILIYNRRRIYIDNVYFRIHYIWTVLILIAFTVLITSKIYIGEPINCLATKELQDIVKQFCFIHATFTRGKLERGNWAYESGKDLYHRLDVNLKLIRILINNSISKQHYWLNGPIA